MLDLQTGDLIQISFDKLETNPIMWILDEWMNLSMWCLIRDSELFLFISQGSKRDASWILFSITRECVLEYFADFESYDKNVSWSLLGHA